jgi:HEAT repeat protein
VILLFALAAGAASFAYAEDVAEPVVATDSPEARIHALLGLQGQGEVAIVAYREALAHPEPSVRAAAVQLLAREAGPAAVASLSPMIDDSDENVVTAAVIALAEIGGEETLAPLRRALASPSPWIRGQAASYIGENLRGALAPEVGELVSDSNPHVRLAAVEALRALSDPASFPYFMAATTDASEDIAHAAVGALVNLGDPRALKRIVLLADSEEPDLRHEVAKAIVAFGAMDEYPEVVARLVADRTPMVARGLAVALYEHPSPAALPVLRDLAAAEDARLRRLTVRALKVDPSPGANELLRSMLSDSNDQVRAAAVLALAARGAAGTVEAAGGLVGDSSPTVRGSVAVALGELGSVEGLAVLETLARDADTTVRISAINAAGRIGTPKAIGVLTLGLKDDHAMVRVEAVRGLGGIDHPKAAKALRKAARGSNLQVRLAAIAELGKLDDPKSVSLLKNLLDDPAEAVRGAARQALDAAAAADNPDS